MHGYILCLLKQFVGTNEPSAYNKTFSFGYFDRIELHEATDFKEMMETAATKNADFHGARKQLLLYSYEFNDKSVLDRIKKQFSSRFDEPQSDGVNRFGCITILNLNTASRERGIRQCAEAISTSISEKLKLMGGIEAAALGVLGTEDLCVLARSDDFTKFEELIRYIQGLRNPSGNAYADNAYSILTAANSTHPPVWGDTTAEICFTIRNQDGIRYVDEIVKKTIQEKDPEASISSGIGEYDVVIRCRADALPADFSWFFNQGIMSYENDEYSKGVVQSATFFFSALSYPAAGNEHKAAGSNSLTLPYHAEETYEVIQGYLIPEKRLADRTDTAYIRFTLYRLLKDYARISVLHNKTVRTDLGMQMRTAINAIVESAKKCTEDGNYIEHKRLFDQDFGEITDAINQAMYTDNQIDKLYFAEQQTHLYNTGAYHKILMAYYGMVYDVIDIVYSFNRAQGSEQPFLIPVIRFGMGPIVESNSYRSTSDGNPAFLLRITLPYQALSNMPKYTGLLVHEIFHYSAPLDRAKRNEAEGEVICLIMLKKVFEVLMTADGRFDIVDANGIIQYYREHFETVASGMNQFIISAIKREYQTLQLWSKQFRSILLNDSLDLMSGAPFITSNYIVKFYADVFEGLIDLIVNDTEPVSQEIPGFSWIREYDQKTEKAEYFRALLNQTFTGAGYERLSGLTNGLSRYIAAFSELAPDLSDITFVMRGKDRAEQLRQYLWQIHSIRCDLLSYQYENHDIDYNSLRIGLIIDWLLGVKTDDIQEQLKERLSDYLNSFFVENSQDSEEGEHKSKLKHRIMEDYDVFLDEVYPFQPYLMKYIHIVGEQVRSVDESLLPKTARLSGFYQRYYNLFERGGEETVGERFDLNIEMMEAYQRYDKPELATPLSDSFKHSEPWFWRRTNAAAIPASLPNDLSERVQQAIQAVSPLSHTAPIWFRGQNKANDLLPTILRTNDAEAEYHNPEYDPLKKYQKSENGVMRLISSQIDLIKARAGTMIDVSDYGNTDFITLAQHYGLLSTALDWSEDFNSALFFAIEDWIEYDNDPRKAPEKEPRENASIIIFNPILYNLYRDVVISPDDDAKNRRLQRLTEYLHKGDYYHPEEAYPIPLLSKSNENKDEFKRYNQFEGYERKYDHDDYPLAAIVQPNNNRLRAQSGVFTFYSMYSKFKSESRSFNHLDLNHIQKEYLNMLTKEGIPSIQKFVYQISINYRNYKYFVDYVHDVGIRKYKLYPEIDKVSGGILEELHIK